MSYDTFLNKTKHTGRKLFLSLRRHKYGLDTLDGDGFAMLWASVMGAGAAWYFTLAVEPAWPVTGVFAGAASLLAVLMIRIGGGWWRRGWLVMALAAGFLVAQTHTSVRMILEEKISVWPVNVATKISGRVETVTRFPDGQVLFLRPAWIEQGQEKHGIGGARLYWRAGKKPDAHYDSDYDPAVFRPGDVIAGMAMLAPKSGPWYPGGYDPRLKDFFDGVAVRGHFLGLPTLRDEQESGFWQWLGMIRQTIEKRLLDVLSGATGGIAAALIIGNQAAIPPNNMADIRESGLAHLLSISGIHMAMVGGLFFVLVRRALLGVHIFSAGAWLSFPAMRRIAAVCAIIAGGWYLLLAGASVPAVRSYIALLLVMAGILTDRSVVNFRMLAVAIVLVVLSAPAQVLNPGAQMSFLSVVALVGAYRWWKDSALRTTIREHWLPSGWPGRVLMVPVELAFTSVVAGAATTPIALASFGMQANYGILSNMIAVPLASFWVMPMGAAGLVMMPFGLDGPFWVVMGWGIDIIVALARMVAGLPGAMMLQRSLPGLFLVLVMSGVLLLSLGRALLPVAALCFVILAGCLMFVPPPPLVLVSMRDQAYGLVINDHLIISDRTTKGRRTRAWQQAVGTDRAWTIRQATKAGFIACDTDGCAANSRHGVLAFDSNSGRDDCIAARWVLSFHSELPCGNKDLFALARQSPGWHMNAITTIRFDDAGKPVFAHTPEAVRPWQLW